MLATFAFLYLGLLIIFLLIKKSLNYSLIHIFCILDHIFVMLFFHTTNFHPSIHTSKTDRLTTSSTIILSFTFAPFLEIFVLLLGNMNRCFKLFLSSTINDY